MVRVLRRVAGAALSSAPLAPLAQLASLVYLRLSHRSARVSWGTRLSLSHLGSYSFGKSVSLGETVIEPYASIGDYSELAGGIITSSKEHPTTIGKWCLFGRDLMVENKDHPLEFPAINRVPGQTPSEYRSRFSERRVTIGNDVWLGAGVRVLKGVTIGDGAVVGTGAVVTRDLPPYSISVGIPARPIRYRFPHPVVQGLQSIRWWDWDVDKMRRNSRFFTTSLAHFSGRLSDLVVG